MHKMGAALVDFDAQILMESQKIGKRMRNHIIANLILELLNDLRK